MSKIVGLAIMAGGIVLAIIIGQRMSTDAMAVVVGVTVGVVASIPTSLLVMAAMRRGQPSYERPPSRPDIGYPSQPAQPQIYVVNSTPAPSGRPQLSEPASYPMPPQQRQPAQRRYTVVGDDDWDQDE